MKACLHGVSTCKVDDLVEALGADTGISQSEVSHIRAAPDAEVGSSRKPPLGEQAFPYVFLDATYCKARVLPSADVPVPCRVSVDGRRTAGRLESTGPRQPPACQGINDHVVGETVLPPQVRADGGQPVLEDVSL